MTEEQAEQFIQGHNLKDVEVEQIALTCKRAGLSPGETIHVLVRAKSIAFGEAKKLMHNSSAWQPERANWDRFHQAIEDVLRANPKLGEDRAE